MNDQQRVQKFLEEFSKRLVDEFGDDIDFILLFGSAARGEWKKGVSDVDLIIQLKTSQRKEEISKKAEKIFWQLDQKYKTEFQRVCSIGDNKDPIKLALREARLYVPFEIFGPDEIDWENARIKKKELLLGAELVAPQSMLFLKMKYEGKILYGRDIRKIIKVKILWREKLKALLVPFYVALASVIVFFFSPKIALKMADKAVIYSIESFLFFLDKPIGKGIDKSLREFQKEVKKNIRPKYRIVELIELDILLSLDYKKHIEFVKEAIKIKYDFDNSYKQFRKIDILKFCLCSLFFVNTTNWYAIVRKDRDRVLVKILIFLRIIILLFILTFFLRFLSRII